MRVYFDECYDGNHSYLVLGALFNPEPRQIHQAFLEIKKKRNYVYSDGSVREIKYSLCNTHARYIIAAGGIECFIKSSSFFRAIVIDQRPESGFSLNYFGKPGESRVIKEARAYKRYAELLLTNNCSYVTNGVLLTDRLTRCDGDSFMTLMADIFTKTKRAGEPPTFRAISEVDTALEQYQVGQLGDILQGVILAELCPPSNEWKLKIRECVKTRLGIPSLKPDYWANLPKWKQHQAHPKYQIWYWKPSEV